jgi:hypothetical protein
MGAGLSGPAIHRLHEATEVAEASGHPESIAFAAIFGVWLHHFFDDVHKDTRILG